MFPVLLLANHRALGKSLPLKCPSLSITGNVLDKVSDFIQEGVLHFSQNGAKERFLGVCIYLGSTSNSCVHTDKSCDPEGVSFSPVK